MGRPAAPEAQREESWAHHTCFRIQILSFFETTEGMPEQSHKWPNPEQCSSKLNKGACLFHFFFSFVLYA